MDRRDVLKFIGVGIPSLVASLIFTKDAVSAVKKTTDFKTAEEEFDLVVRDDQFIPVLGDYIRRKDSTNVFIVSEINPRESYFCVEPIFKISGMQSYLETSSLNFKDYRKTWEYA